MNTTQRRLAAAALALILLSAFALRWRAADHRYISQWDEAYHALVAKNLLLHPFTPTLYDNPLRAADFKDWSESSIWLHKPPVPLWLMAAAMKTGGEEEIIFRLPSVLLGTLTAWLLFRIAARLFPEEGVLPGLLAGLFFALNPLMLRLTSGTIPTDHVDISLVFFITLAVFLAIRAHGSSRPVPWITAGLAMGVAFLCKSWPALVALLAVLPLLAADHRQIRPMFSRAAYLLGGFLALPVPWHLYCYFRWPKEYAWEMSYNFWTHLTTAVEGHDQPIGYYLGLIPTHFGGIAAATYLLVVAGCLGCLWRFFTTKDKRLAVLMIWAFSPYLVFSFTQTKMYSYMAPAVPGMTLLLGLALVQFMGPGALRRTVLISLVFALHFVPLAWQRTQANYEVPTWNHAYDYVSFRENFRNLQREKGNKVVFNVADRKQPQAMFYGGCTAYADLPSVRELIAVADQGWRVFVVVPEPDPGAGAWMEEVARQGGLRKIGFLHIRTGAAKPQNDPYRN